MGDDYPKPHEEEWCDCIACRNWHMRDLDLNALWAGKIEYADPKGNGDYAADLRARGVWPFNQSETRTEMAAVDYVDTMRRLYKQWDNIVNLPRESMRGEK